MTNARSARQAVAARLGEMAVGDHFCAVSTQLDKIAAFGIRSDRVFGFWDWVGGRYSIWSSIGLLLAIGIGKEKFEEPTGKTLTSILRRHRSSVIFRF
jgi:glucose-6-phosphate isomerase